MPQGPSGGVWLDLLEDWRDWLLSKIRPPQKKEEDKMVEEIVKALKRRR